MYNKLRNVAIAFMRNSIFKIILFFFTDCLCVSLSLIISLMLKFGIVIPEIYRDNLVQYIFLWVLLIPVIMLFLRCYNSSIRDFSVIDAIRICASITLGFGLLVIFNGFVSFPLADSVLIITLVISVSMLMGYRFFLRMLIWVVGRYNLRYPGNAPNKNTLIYGAGDAGAHLIDILTYSNKKGLCPVGIIDDDPDLWGKRIKGLKVYGGRSAIPHIFEDLKIEEIILTIPSVGNAAIKEIYDYCCKANCHISRFSNLSSLTLKDIQRNQENISDIKLEDLLGRDEVRLDMDLLEDMISGKTVLITGGAGSIGSEICRRALAYHADKILIFDTNENGLFEMDYELNKIYSRDKYATIVGSVRDVVRIREVMKQYNPQIVFHAAAHKHVPMMELNPLEAFHNNILGTYNVAMVAIENYAERVVLISTDKAVNPTSIMGVSKRIAELVMQHADRHSNTKCMAVRFGNVLGSNGSVVPTFKQQIEAGGPVTVTHKEMKRYFMTIPEAVKLVFQAASLSVGSEIFVLNMGDPIYIYDLACTMIRLSGYIPEEEIKVEISGLRPGEKLFEELKLDNESVEKTQNDQIFVLKSTEESDKIVQDDINIIQKAIITRNIDVLTDVLERLVPAYPTHHLSKFKSTLLPEVQTEKDVS